MARVQPHVVVVAATLYSALMFLWVHGDLDDFLARASDEAGLIVFLGAGLGVGLATGRWVALTLALVPVMFGLILTATGFHGPGVEPVPPWFLPLILLPLIAGAIAVGVLMRKRGDPTR